MLAGRIKCDFCGFIGEMVSEPLNKGTVSVPSGWISIHPMIVVHGMRGLKKTDELFKRKDEIKAKVLKKVQTIHCCMACVTDRNVFDLQLSLPAAAQTVRENYMKNNR